MNLAPFIVFFLIRYLRKTLKTFSPNPVWEKRLLWAMYATIALFVLTVVFSNFDKAKWLWHIAQFTLIGVTIKLPEFAHARKIMWGVVPLIVLSFISDLVKDFANDIYLLVDSYMDIAGAVAITWMLAMIVISNRQTKLLEKERAKRLEEEERHRLVEAQKLQLEHLVAERTVELTRQKEELQNALIELQSTQKQLIQSEKMASLGELTAGIAHEIQNPLNFVNNFSEVSAELVNEMKEELQAKNESAVTVILQDLEQNLQKITHHGKRADAIVKGMLLHSRSSTGIKEPTDINALADEYLRLSYHGLRAKDKSFNATMKVEFDEKIGTINIITQDIGRVLLNLFTNAFYSITEKKKAQRVEGTQKFEPTVSVTTKLITNGSTGAERTVMISVKDNGTGIPQEVLDKIYHPFFTTKPTGDGTGLGLSISYDIIKAHGGEIKVETKDGEGAEFIISLPIN
jgi:signal transduction histidine kinase